jgi:hypothetical protein
MEIKTMNVDYFLTKGIQASEISEEEKQELTGKINSSAKALLESMQRTDAVSAKHTAEAARLRKKYGGNG